MNRVFYACFIFSLIFTSCNSDDDVSLPLIEEVNFYALTIGNSWEYEYFRKNNQTGDFESLEVFENVSLIGTEVINDLIYYNFEKTTTGNPNPSSCAVCNENGVQNQFYRDSLGYLINEAGIILFSNENTEVYLVQEQFWGTTYGFLELELQEFEVEAGIFATKENIVYAILSDGTEGTGMDRSYYSEMNGLVLQKYATVQSQTHLFEKRLKSYSIIEE